LSGLLPSLTEVPDRVWVDVRAKRKSTFARHPIIRLYLHHLFHLAFDGQVPEWEWGKPITRLNSGLSDMSQRKDVESNHQRNSV
jgi:hypothetical protein